MTDAALIAELRQTVQRIALVSHVAGVSWDGRIARDTSESIGGRRPPGGDREPKPRPPRSPLIEGDAASEKAWDEYGEEIAAWQSCYQRRTPQYFQRQLDRCHSDADVRGLLEEARETLAAWRRAPIPAGQPPALGDPQWKRWVGESSLQTGELARMFSVTRQYIQRVRRGYRAAT